MLKYLLPLSLLFGCQTHPNSVNIYIACSGPFNINKPVKGHIYLLHDNTYQIDLEDGLTFYLPVNNCYLITKP